MNETQNSKGKTQNYKLKFKTFYFLVVLLTFEFLLLTFPNYVRSVANPVSYDIEVSATIGEPKLTLFGYTSPNALVQLEGQGVAEEVIADEQGYFFFDRIFLPKPNPEYPELCLTSIDTQSRTSFPTCLPSLPTGPFDITIGPILLSPTLSLSKGSFLPQEQVVAEGLTIPNTEVNIFLANDSPSSQKFSISKYLNILISPAYAYSLPQYQIKADQNGRFEFNLPTIKRSNWKIFAGALYQGSPTPKSNTLNFKILNWWQWLLLMITNLLGAFLRLIKPFWWLCLILTEILLVFYLLLAHRHLKKKTSMKVKLHSLG